MATLIIILGILMIIFGALCAFTPLATLAAAGFFIAAVLIVSGAMGIITGILSEASFQVQRDPVFDAPVPS